MKPLRKQLKTLQAWITGQRKDQSPGTRMAVPVVEVDPVFEGQAGGPGSLIKYNPLSNISSAEVRGVLGGRGGGVMRGTGGAASVCKCVCWGAGGKDVCCALKLCRAAGGLRWAGHVGTRHVLSRPLH